MFKRLLILSLIVIPFYEVFLYLLMPGRVYPIFPDMRVTKDFMAMGFSMGIGSVVLCKYGFTKIKNIWIPIFLTFLVWNIEKAPGSFIVNGVSFTGLWDYKSSYQLFVYFFLFLGISNLPDIDTRKIFKTMAYCGLAMAVIMILQRLGLDQIFNILPVEVRGTISHPEMGGTLGQNTLSAPFIIMTIPFMVYLRKWFLAAIMAITVLFADSTFAILGLGAMVISMVIMSKNRILICVVSVLIVGLGLAYVNIKPDILISNGRFPMWKMVIKDIYEGKIILTGAGIGAFKYLFALKYKNTWYHAHCEPLQLLWSCGLIGAFIAFMAVKNYTNILLKKLTCENKAIFASCIGIAVISCGTFPLQLAAYQYYLIVMAGIIYKNENRGI